MAMETFSEERLGEFMGMMAGYMTGGALCFSVLLGDELGLYRAMTGAGSLSADEVAKRADCNVRLTREWLDGQVAGGLLGYGPARGTPAHPPPGPPARPPARVPPRARPAR